MTDIELKQNLPNSSVSSLLLNVVLGDLYNVGDATKNVAKNMGEQHNVNGPRNERTQVVFIAIYYFTALVNRK